MGTNNVIRAVQSGEAVSPLLVPAIFLGTVLTHLCGGSAGREGAALQMGGSIGYNVGRLFRLSDHDRRTATVCGMAAFFSALFGTPLAATLFAMMVEDVGLTFSVAFVPGFTWLRSSPTAVSLACGISPTRFALADAPALTADAVLKVMVLGAACAVVSRLFCGLLHFTEHELPKRLPNPWVRAAVGGMAGRGPLLPDGRGPLQRRGHGGHCGCRGAGRGPALGFPLQGPADRHHPGLRLQGR